jgi:hypothetical protein
MGKNHQSRMTEENVTYVGIRNIKCSDSCGKYSNSDIIYDVDTDNLVHCVRELNKQRKKDIIVHEKGEYVYEDMRNCCESGYKIVYTVGVYEYRDYGITKWLDTWTDKYQKDDRDDRESVTTLKGKFHNIDIKHRDNILKCISDCVKSDKEAMNHVGNIDYNYINKLLEKQEYLCHRCGDQVITHSYASECDHKFSISRIDSEKPHDKKNVRILCNFCNHQNEMLLGNASKQQCEDKGCFCNDDLYIDRIKQG